MFKYLILLFALCACGNADQGIGPKKSKSNPVAKLSQTASAPTVDSGLCKTMQAYKASNLTSSDELNGASLCTNNNSPALLTLKVSANFPATTRYCLVPLNSAKTFTASCFIGNGQIPIGLSTSDFTDVALVSESNLNSFLLWANGGSVSFPAFAYVSLR